MPRSLAVSAALHEELTVNLEDLLDEQEDMKSKKALINRAINVELNTVAEAIYTVRRRLKGMDLEQTEIPGTETIHRKRDAAVIAILKSAGPLVEAAAQREAAKQSELGLDDPLSQQADAKKARTEKPPPKPLDWEPAGENLLAITPLGTYCIEPGLAANAGTFGLFWTLPEGTSKRLETTATQSAAKDLARKDWLARNADAILKNAGDGRLTGGRPPSKSGKRRPPEKKRSHHKRRA